MSVKVQKVKEQVARHHVVVLGGAGVGKSKILARYVHNKFTDKYVPTAEEFHSKKLMLNDRVIMMDIVDTSGINAFPAMRDLALSKATAFVLVYRLDEESSFEALRAIREEIKKARGGADIPTIVVGNMSDRDRQCKDKATMECLVNMDWNHAYVETSAKENINIDTIFEQLMLRCQIPGVSANSPAANASPKQNSTKKKKACVIL
jgi:small GTP-binding protein